MKCVDGRTVEGQDGESTWKHLFLTNMCLCINFLLRLLSRLKA